MTLDTNLNLREYFSEKEFEDMNIKDGVKNKCLLRIK